MEEALHDSVRERARYRCEYCHFPDAFAELPFHLDHIIARQHGGKTVPENLAWTCCYCNRYKGPNLSSVDPLTKETVDLFHPRRAMWPDHFDWRAAELVAKTASGRATIELLRINRSDAVAVRAMLMKAGVFPLAR